MADERGLPKASVNKLLAELVPSDMKLSADVRDMLADCCTEFVQLVASQAAEVSDKDKKSTVQPEHVVTSLQDLGFGAYTGEVSAAVECWKQEDKATSQKRSANKEKGKAQGMTDEEAAAAQQKLFAEARARVFGTQ